MANKNSRWSVAEDDWLWKFRTVSIVTLAELIKRTKSAVAYRLQDLRNPKHKAHQRLMLYRGKPIGQRVIHCDISHGALKTQKATFESLVDSILNSTTINKGSRWNMEDDVCLNKNKDCCYDELAAHHGRTLQSIRQRMEALADPNSSVSQRLTNPKKSKKKRQPSSTATNSSESQGSKKGQRWTIEDDDSLWRLRDSSIQQLAERFRRTTGSIICRLESLRDPQHKVNTQLAEYCGKSIGKRNISCTGSHRVGSELSVISNHEEFEVEEDLCLFSNRDCCVLLLAKHLYATPRAIKEGLALLMDENDMRRIRLDQYLKDGKTKRRKKRKKRRRRDDDCDDDDEKIPGGMRKKRKLNKEEAPTDFCDPITYKLMDEPTLVTLSGYTYERETILDCIKNNGRDPFTNIKINKNHLVLNRALKESIVRWKRDNLC